MKLPPQLLLPAAIVVGLIGLWQYAAWDGRQAERSRQSAAALAAARSEVDLIRGQLTSTQFQLDQRLAELAVLQARETRHIADADRDRARANALIRLVPAADSAQCRPVMDAYEARTSECAQLRLALATAAIAQALADTGLREARDSVRVLLARELPALTHQLTVVTKPYVCRILFVRCPSRTLSAVLGVAAGAVGFGVLVRK